MKKLIIFVLTLFLTFTIFLSSKIANAELTPVTPFYEGDIFNGKELYLFQNYNATPNFENGYISKKTISQQDVYYQENSFYNGWYKDLGRDLIDTFTEPEHEPENPYFWFYIPLNNMTSQYLQLALIMPEPYESDFYIKFKNQTPINFLTTNGNGDYLITPPTTDMLKEIEWICYSVYYQDYLASFRTLTAQIAYDFGFSAGESSGFNNGHNVGYNTGYSNGYNQGLSDASQPGYVEIQVYNQLQRKLTSTSDFYVNDVSGFRFEDGVFSFTSRVQAGNVNAYPKRIQTYAGHKYYVSVDIKTTTNQVNVVLGDNVFYTRNTNNQFLRFSNIIQFSTSAERSIAIYDRRSSNWDMVSFKDNVMVIDLTLMYGSGNEPNIETCRQIFLADYYPYNTGEPININYLDGYNEGWALGYEKGKDIQATQQLTSTGWISSIFGGISSLLNIQIFPGVTIGIIVGIPFVISLAYFVIRAFRGGGGA